MTYQICQVGNSIVSLYFEWGKMWQFMEIKGNVKRRNQSCLKSQSFNLEKWTRKELVSPKKKHKEENEKNRAGAAASKYSNFVIVLCLFRLQNWCFKRNSHISFNLNHSWICRKLSAYTLNMAECDKNDITSFEMLLKRLVILVMSMWDKGTINEFIYQKEMR